MTSVFNGGTKTNLNDAGYYITVGTIVNKVNALTTNADGTTQFATASWCALATGNNLGALSTVSSASSGLILKDMGKTVVSSLRTFRKIQLVLASGMANLTNPSGANSFASTFGVGGRQGTSPVEDYLTGYIELGFEGNGVPAPVAHFGR